MNKLYTVKEAAEYLQVSPRSIYRYMADDENPLKAYKIGKSWRIDETDLKYFTMRCQKKPNKY